MQEYKAPVIKMTSGSRRVSWKNSFSPMGYKLSEVVSALIKEMRRGKEEEAVFWAYQLMISGEEAEEFMWERFKVFPIEDVTVGCPESVSIVHSAESLYYSFPTRSTERHATASFVAVYLARCTKTRYSCDMFSYMRDKVNIDGLRLDIPDYAKDFHLQEYRDAGRDRLHYLTEASKIEGELSINVYRKKLIEREMEKIRSK